MEFITVEQFQEQPVEVQKVFLDWWKVNRTDADLVLLKTGRDKFKLQIINNIDMVCVENDEITPLFTEGQLRKFIEDKEGCLLDIKVENLHYNYNDYTVIGWEIKELDHGKEFGRVLFEDCIRAEGLLQVYWKVACAGAKEG